MKRKFLWKAKIIPSPPYESGTHVIYSKPLGYVLANNEGEAIKEAEKYEKPEKGSEIEVYKIRRSKSNIKELEEEVIENQKKILQMQKSIWKVVEWIES